MTLLPHQFGSSIFQTKLLEVLKFETKSWLGRARSRIYTPSERYIQLGAGMTPVSQFENLDFYSFRPFKGNQRIVGHDLRYPLPYHDQVFEGAFCEHTMEHLYPNQANTLMKEIYRILKPGAIFRCTVPDLKKYVDFYTGKAVDPAFQQFESGCEAIWSLSQNWGHLSIWDYPMLSRKLTEAGFSSVSEKKFHEGNNRDLLVDLEDRKWETLYVEAVR